MKGRTMENAELSLQLRSMQNEGCMMKDENKCILMTKTLKVTE